MNNIRTRNLIVMTVVFVFSVIGASAQRLERDVTADGPVINCLQMPEAAFSWDSKVKPGADLKNEAANKTVYPRFVVAKTDNATAVTWTNAFAKCTGGWRLPTQRELMLIYLLQYQLEMTSGFVQFSDQYWAATEDVEDNRYSWVMRFSIGYTGRTFKTTSSPGVRCIKELPQPPKP